MESLGDQLFASFTGSLFGLELGGLDSDFLPLFINSPLLCIFFFFSFFLFLVLFNCFVILSHEVVFLNKESSYLSNKNICKKSSIWDVQGLIPKV